MEAMKGGDLFDRLVKKKVYPEDEARVVIRNIVKAVLYLHEQGLVHRDLKPENMLLASKKDHVTVKIADFGFSKNIEEGNLLSTPCGSPGYVAPEIANEQSYTTGVDLWSVGVIMYTMLVGFPPFYSDDNEQLLDLVSEGKYTFPKKYWRGISRDAKHLITKLLEKNTTERYTAQQVLQHPWITFGTEDTASTGTEVNRCTKNIISQQKQKENKASPLCPSKECDFEFQMVRGALNMSIDLQRDGCLLRSATESSIFTRRKKKKEQNEPKAGDPQPIPFALDL